MSGEAFEYEKITDVINDIKKLAECRSWSGGFDYIRLDGNTEPLVYQHRLPVINELRNELPDMPLKILTNGVLLDEIHARSLLLADVDSIYVSVTGHTTEVYKEFQGSNLPERVCEKNLETVKRNVRRAIRLKKELNKKTIIEVRYIMSNISRKEFIPYMSYWRKWGADRILLTGMGNTVLAPVSRPLGKIVGYKRCFVWGVIVIKANGDVLLSCCNYQMDPVGNVNKTSFFDIMTSEKVRKYIKGFDAIDLGAVPRICATCPNIHIYDESSE